MNKIFTICKLIIFFFFLFLFFCTRNYVSNNSGGGIDIGNPAKICVVDSAGKPVKYATVKLIPSDLWLNNLFTDKNIVSDSAITNEAGMVTFFLPEDTVSYNIQIDHPDGGNFLRAYQPIKFNTTIVLTLKRYGILKGFLKSITGKPLKLFLCGTSYYAQILSDGSYLIPCLPEGNYFSFVMNEDSLWNTCGTINVLSAETTIVTRELLFNEILVEDFEDSINTKTIFSVLKKHFIYNKHADNVGTSAGYELVKESVDGSTALKGTLIRNKAWALIGIFLGLKPLDNDSVWDLSNSKGLLFHAKGRGIINVSFESDTIDKMGYYKHYSSSIELTSEWKEFRISFDSLSFINDANPIPPVSWKASAKSIKRIEFNALEGDTAILWLDNIKLIGVDFIKIWGQDEKN